MSKLKVFSNAQHAVTSGAYPTVDRANAVEMKMLALCHEETWSDRRTIRIVSVVYFGSCDYKSFTHLLSVE